MRTNHLDWAKAILRPSGDSSRTNQECYAEGGRVACMPNSHHYIGVGPISRHLSQSAQRPESLIPHVSDLVRSCGFGIVSEHSAGFNGGGITLVWILSESHLVLHLWVPEGFATVDLHICDFNSSNANAARRLQNELSDFCFEGGQATWKDITVEQPVYAAT